MSQQDNINSYFSNARLHQTSPGNLDQSLNDSSANNHSIVILLNNNESFNNELRDQMQGRQVAAVGG
jgi:hypothetical protein